MAKKINYEEYLYKRPDGLYEKTKTVKGKRHVFRSKDPEQVYNWYINFEETSQLGPMFKTTAEEWKTEHFPTLTHTTQHGYLAAYARVIKEFGNTRTKEITAQQIKAHIKQFSTERAYKTVANELLVIRLILEYACSQDILQYNPAQHVRVPKGLTRTPREFPSDADIAIIKQSHASAPPFGLLHYCALYTGARLGELMALTWGDVDLKEKTISITKSVYWKNNQPKIKDPKTEAGHRDVPILDKLYTVLKPLKGKKSEYLFAVDGKLPSHSTVSRGRNRFRRTTGAKASPHQLRHAYATMLFEAGVDEKTSQYLLGHAQLSTTMDIYTQLRQNKVIEAAKKLNNIDIAT